MILATKYAKNVITSANPIWYRRNKSSWATLTYAAPHTVFPQCNDQEDWDHVVCEYISKIQILKPEKLAKNGVMQEIHHVLCYGSWKTTIIKTLWYIFNIQAIKQFDLQSLAGTFSTDKGRLIFKLGTPWSLDLFWKSLPCFSPIVMWKSLSRTTAVPMLYPSRTLKIWNSRYPVEAPWPNNRWFAYILNILG